MNRIFLLFLVFPLPGLLAAQDLPQPAVTADTVSLLYALKKGSIQGHARLFSMATDNTGALSDYAATAIGGGIRYKSAGFHGFSIGLGGYFIYKLASSDLSKPDPLTNAANRYEIGLFDIQQAKNKSDMNRLEELFLQYQHQSLTVTVGKQLPEMPFINQQDGRMRATGIDGLLLKWKTGKTGSLQAAYLWQISPRSTVRWFSIGESIGVYPMGQTVSGKPGDYQHNLQSKGVLITGWEQKIKKALTLQLWNQFTENIFNTALLQTDLRLPLQPQTAFTAGFQLIRQDALHDGGNPDPAKTYFEKGGKSWVLGGSAGMDYHNWNASFNYTRITKDGRYLMPREWGRDPFYTFLQRERNDGYANLDALSFKLNYKLDKWRTKLFLGYGHYYLPPVSDAAANKYAMPSYRQLNLSWKYNFHRFLSGMDIQALYVHKAPLGPTPASLKYQFNKVNMSNYNLIINYVF